MLTGHPERRFASGLRATFGDDTTITCKMQVIPKENSPRRHRGTEKFPIDDF
jgi:hypothetical protein